MSQTDERRPVLPGRRPEDAAAKPLSEVHSTAIADESVGVQIRRRRQESFRHEPLKCGRRDPLARRQVPEAGKHLVVETGKHTVWLRDGRRGDRVFNLLDAAQVERRQWDADRRCWMVPVTRADDVLAYAEYADRWSIACTAVDR